MAILVRRTHGSDGAEKPVGDTLNFFLYLLFS